VADRLARRAGVPFVYDARDIYVESNNVARLPWPARRLFLARERRWARRAARVITVNESCAAHLEGSLGIPRPAVVMNGQRAWVPPDPPPDHLRRLLGLAADRRVVLYHGGFMPDRGLPELMRAIALPGLESAELVLMGSGAIEPAIRRLAADSPAADRIHLVPPVPPDELLGWVASADVGVMPNQPRTLNERLSTPNKLFECLAAGTPVVSSDFPERRRILLAGPEGPLGAVCDPRDPASIAAAIGSILALDPEARAALRARCRAAAETRYGWDAQFLTLLDVYGGVTGRRW
jgi:glycosyltransferase involved in cell wall biosynthesis